MRVKSSRFCIIWISLNIFDIVLFGGYLKLKLVNMVLMRIMCVNNGYFYVFIGFCLFVEVLF